MQLVKYEAAKHALAEAKAVDEVKQLHDVATAMKAYAIQAKDKQLEIDACEIRIRAERRLGEMIKHQKKTVGLAQGRRTDLVPDGHQVDNRQTLSDVGISKKLSSRSQAIASIPADEFELTLAEHRDEQSAVTARTMETLARKAHVSNNSGNNEWYTPTKYIEAARRTMGTIDTDPASSMIANKAVKATQYFTIENDGLLQTWVGNVWMNPPYAQPAIKQFSEAISDKYKSGEITSACILVNNATETAWFRCMLDECSAICFPSGRVKFLDPTGSATGAPLQGQAIIYFGEDIQSFTKHFSIIGKVLLA